MTMKIIQRRNEEKGKFPGTTLFSKLAKQMLLPHSLIFKFWKKEIWRSFQVNECNLVHTKYLPLCVNSIDCYWRKWSFVKGTRVKSWLCLLLYQWRWFSICGLEMEQKTVKGSWEMRMFPKYSIPHGCLMDQIKYMVKKN